MRKHAKRVAAPTSTVPRFLWDIVEVSASLGVRPVTVRSYVERGYLRPVDLPSTAKRRPQDKRLRKLLFRPEDVRAFVERQQADPR